jgi:hypothetical protein
VSDAPGAASATASTMSITSTPGSRWPSAQVTHATRRPRSASACSRMVVLPNPAPATSSTEPRSIASLTRPARRGRGIARQPPTGAAPSVGCVAVPLLGVPR